MYSENKIQTNSVETDERERERSKGTLPRLSQGAVISFAATIFVPLCFSLLFHKHRYPMDS
jgi:hypothetical protein